MIIKSIEELRLSAPSHAIDSFDNIAGIIDNVEHDVLEEKLGTPLYTRLCQWYAQSDATRSTIDAPAAAPALSSAVSPAVGSVDGGTTAVSYYNRLWLACIRIVTQSALGRYAPQQAVSLNNAGVNQFTATDYPAASQQSIEAYQKSCFQESAAACNRLLRLLEEWTKQAALAADTDAQPLSAPVGEGSGVGSDTSDSDPSSVSGDAIADNGSVSGGTTAAESDAELQEIVTLWRTGSRYYYLSTQLLIPTATCLQTYINFAENRERFIQMLPDLLFIQEEIIANSIGEDFLAYLVECSVNGGSAAVIDAIIHRLRKVMAAILVSRTSVLKFDKAQKVQGHDDGVRMLDVACTYIRNHQSDLLATLGEERQEVFETSPLYVAPNIQSNQSIQDNQTCGCCQAPSSDDTRVFAKGDTAAWTPPLF